jgi:hypothetical protein
MSHLLANQSYIVRVIFFLLQIAVQRKKNIFFILPDYEVDHGIAEVADTIEENDWLFIHFAKLPTKFIADYEKPSAHLHPVPVYQLISKHPAPGLLAIERL